MQRRGVTPDLARAIMRTNTTAIGAVMVHRGEADSLICGTFGQYLWHLNYVRQVLARTELRPIGALSLMIHEKRGDLRRRHPGPSRADAAGDRRRRRSRRRGMCAASGWSRRSRCARIRSSATSTPVRAGGCARRSRSSTRRSSTSTTRARCIPTRRSIPELRARIFPNAPLRGAGERADLRQHRRGERGAQHHQDGRAAGSRSGRS